MIEFDEDALICDLAETYQVLDYKALPPQLVAVLSLGLREDSRIIMKMQGVVGGQKDRLLAMVNDNLANILYVLGAKKGSKPPKSILDTFFIDDTEDKDEGFDSLEDFQKAWDSL